MRAQSRNGVAARTLPVAALLGYAALWLGYRHGWAALAGVDSVALSGAYQIATAHPGWVCLWDGVCTLFGPPVLRVLGLVVTVYALARRRPRAALFVLVSIEFSGLVTETAKHLAGRPRPPTALVATSSSSFPSGHALAAMVAVAALLTVALPVANRPVAAVLPALGALVVVAVGVGRVALNVHHPSDVLAGWALGYAYCALCAGLLRPRTDRPRQEPKPGS